MKIGALFFAQFGTEMAINFQLFGMVTAYKFMKVNGNLSLAAYLTARKRFLKKNEKISSSSPSSWLSRQPEVSWDVYSLPV